MNKKDVLKAIKIDMPNKVDKVEGKGLSTNDYTTTDKQEVAKVKDKADKSIVDAIYTNGIIPTSLNAILGSEQFPFKDVFVGNRNISPTIGTGFMQETNGTIKQWIIVDGNTWQDGIIKFPIAFPTRNLTIHAQLINASDNWGGNVYVQSIDRANFRLIYTNKPPMGGVICITAFGF